LLAIVMALRLRLPVKTTGVVQADLPFTVGSLGRGA